MSDTSVCGKPCDHGSPCALPVGHTPADRHETEHGCVFYDARRPLERLFDEDREARLYMRGES